MTSDDDFAQMESRPGSGGASVGALFAVAAVFILAGAFLYAAFH